MAVKLFLIFEVVYPGFGRFCPGLILIFNTILTICTSATPAFSTAGGCMGLQAGINIFSIIPAQFSMNASHVKDPAICRPILPIRTLASGSRARASII